MGLFSSFGLRAQDDNDKGAINRRPVFAGQFYAAHPDTLRKDLKNLFEQAVPKKHDNVIAIVTPHAGYVFSGKTAASAYNQIDRQKKYDNIFVITTSHRAAFDGASIYYIGHYITPLGEVKVNRKLAKELTDKHACFTFKREAHAQEHSLEVQLPFLQYALGNDIKIVPIVIGTHDTQTLKEMSAALSPYFHSNNLFVISTDFSHYPTYSDAKTIDSKTARIILQNSTAALSTHLQSTETAGTKGLATQLCGWTSVMTLLGISEKHQNVKVHIVDETNSGDSEHGDHNRVVGYAALAFTTGEKGIRQSDETKNVSADFSLSQNEKDKLISLVKETLLNYIPHRRIPDLRADSFPGNLQAPLGVFVSLYAGKQLRGCIGRFSTTDPLYETVQQMSIAAATEDYRFKPVTEAELKGLSVEVSVLTPMKKIAHTDEIILGTHGIYIKKGGRTGTFLPQVATETGWSLEEFLGYCARDKAGIGWDGWKDAEIYIYSALVFGEKK